MTDARPQTPPSPTATPVPRREIFAWAMYDFANSGYTTVVLTAVFSAYFVGVVASDGTDKSGASTLLWTAAMAITNILMLASAPCLEPEKCHDIYDIEGEQQHSTPAFDMPAPCWPDKRHGYYPEHQGYRYLPPIY